MSFSLLAVFFCEGERLRLRAARLSRERERDLEREPLELQEVLRCPVLCEGLFLRSEAPCRECFADDSELLLGRPRWCLSFTFLAWAPWVLSGLSGWEHTEPSESLL